LGFLLKGFVLGFSIAAPVGPIGLLCIRRSLADGRVVGLLTGLGAATADAVYGGIAAFGLTAVSGMLVAYRTWLGLLGGVFLCYLGVRTMVSSAPAESRDSVQTSGLASAYASTFVLTLTNPMTILSFVAVFAGIGLVSGSGSRSAAMLVAGVFAGSAAWWLLLSTGTSMLRTAIGPRVMTIVNQVSGTLIVAFGIYAIATSFRR
jgi:threonine/homoserine/homoserine lactone efflux protein